MGFNLKQHLQDHALYFAEYSEIKNTDLHFNFSFLDLQFLNRNVEAIMHALLEELRNPQSYKEKNGKDADGIQKYTTRPFNLNKYIKAEAIHVKGINNEDTMPHIHLVLTNSGRYGKSYSLLKKHIITIAQKYDLIPNFDDKIENIASNTHHFSKGVSAITWSWQKMTNTQLRKYIDSNKLTSTIDKVYEYCLITNNLSYYVKSMETLKRRLNRLRLNVKYKGHDLKDTFPLPLTKEDMKVIRLIQNKKFTQKDMRPFARHPILRDYIRLSAKTTKPFIIDALRHQTYLMNGIRGNQKAVETYKIIAKDINTIHKTFQERKIFEEMVKKDNTLKKDLLSVIKSSLDEKTLREKMQKIGYTGFGLKKRNGSVIGCFYLEGDKKVITKFIDMNLKWRDIKYTLMMNYRKVKSGQELEHLKLLTPPNKSKSIATNKMKTFKNTLPKTINIDYKKEEIAKQKKKQKEKSKLRRIANALIKKTKEAIVYIQKRINNLKERKFTLAKHLERARRKEPILVQRLETRREQHEYLKRKINNAKEAILKHARSIGESRKRSDKEKLYAKEIRREITILQKQAERENKLQTQHNDVRRRYTDNKAKLEKARSAESILEKRLEKTRRAELIFMQKLERRRERHEYIKRRIKKLIKMKRKAKRMRI